MTRLHSISESLPPYLIQGIGVSLLLHIFFAASFSALKPASDSPALDPMRIISVSFAPDENKKEQVKVQNRNQIVSPPEKSVPNEDTQAAALRSEIDSRAAREQIRRGAGRDAGIPGPREKTLPREKEPPQRASRPGLDRQSGQGSKPLKHLRLDPSTTEQRFAQAEGAASNANQPSGSSSAGISRAAATQPFSRPYGSGARFVGLQGDADYLPNLPDGDVTLLNTKADMFAVFVRRVALQVFGALRASGWDFLRAGDIHNIGRDATVRAILSPQGSLMRVVIEDNSGSARFDEVVVDAVKSGAKDPNPPAGAQAKDGNIHFIFKARSWSQMSGDPRTGAPMERRWLLLATGLD